MSNGESVFRQIGASNHSLTEREKDDYYATEPKAIDMLLTKERPAAKIWECACGEGHLSKRLIEKGYTVYSSDKVDRGYGEVRDFLTQRAMPADGCDILTNPPYSVALEFIKKALELVGEENRVYVAAPELFGRDKAQGGTVRTESAAKGMRVFEADKLRKGRRF